MPARYDVLTIGNAIVDVIAHAEEDVLIAQGLNKGAMTLIDEARAEHLYGVMASTVQVSGGCAGNTAAGLASLGGTAAFIGKVKDDELGRYYRHDIQAIGVAYPTAPATDGPATARSFIFVTPDGERTMNTFLGACQNLTETDIDAATVEAAGITYLEGYLWDPPAAKLAFRKAADIAHKAGNRVAITLSDSFCVDRYRAEFLGLVREGLIDILFANEHELKSLFETADFDTALAALREEDKAPHFVAAVTRSEKGAIAVTREQTFAAPAHPIDRLVDSTGAGDLFASGFMYGLARERDLVDCLRFGALAAAEIIQHVGARPQRRLADMATEAGLA